MSYDKLSRDELLKIVKDCKEEKPKRKRVSKVEEDIIDTPKPSVVSLSKLSISFCTPLGSNVRSLMRKNL
jgi:hypothetical protein